MPAVRLVQNCCLNNGWYRLRPVCPADLFTRSQPPSVSEAGPLTITSNVHCPRDRSAVLDKCRSTPGRPRERQEGTLDGFSVMSKAVTAGTKRILGVVLISIKEYFLNILGNRRRLRPYPLGA